MKIKKGFFRALSVFFCCVLLGLITGLIFDILQIGLTVGTGLGLLWMGVAYFNQEDENEDN